MATTAIIQDIKFTIGRYGIIIPIIKLDTSVPTTLIDGKYFHPSSSIIINEIGIYEDQDIGVGTKVELESLEPFVDNNYPAGYSKVNYKLIKTKDNPPLPDGAVRLIPKKCPVCGNIIREFVGRYICNDVTCPASVYQKCLQFVRATGIYLHGPYLAIFSTLIARKLISTPLDIFITTDTSILETLDNITEKHLNLYKLIISDAIGKITLDQLLTGLDIIPYEKHDNIRDFVVKCTTKYRDTEYAPFNIAAIINLVYDTVAKYNLYTEDDTTRGDISAQILKLSDTDYANIDADFCGIGTYRISYIISYITNKNNQNMLLSMQKLDILQQ